MSNGHKQTQKEICLEHTESVQFHSKKETKN